MIERKTSTVESLLGVLSLKPMSGYEMRQFMERSTANFWSESYGQIYPALKRMLADGLVEVEEHDGDGHPAKKVYQITAAGEARLRAWLETPAWPEVRRIEMLLKVFFGSHAPPEMIAEQVRRYRERYVNDLERYLQIEQMLPAIYEGREGLPYFLMSVRYGIAEAKAIVAWADESLETLQAI
jgi:PadR family transcriptional regulator AphA